VTLKSQLVNYLVREAASETSPVGLDIEMLDDAILDNHGEPEEADGAEDVGHILVQPCLLGNSPITSASILTLSLVPLASPHAFITKGSLTEMHAITSAPLLFSLS